MVGGIRQAQLIYQVVAYAQLVPCPIFERLIQIELTCINLMIALGFLLRDLKRVRRLGIKPLKVVLHLPEVLL
jgi:hypothetical protein